MSIKRDDEGEPGNDFAFPDRECEACGTKGGGSPTAGLANVFLDKDHWLCGNCAEEFWQSWDAKRAAAKVEWIDRKRKEVEAA